ncbi:FAD-binding domain-containing protein [Terfezia boudieri ATCC MYA-4762]|uniref:FAD-binding domain-containing protein n=1 Tax=Terfezia boudieri ATCC MYA-4762 TaxID=1051890 RepID=A0A3N4LC51_9PEZI|nr:FAD-binding domain-containing protein [Terfezia boudieri ATCC MYA-4762]
MRSLHHLVTLVVLLAASVSTAVKSSDDLRGSGITQLTYTKQAVFGATVSSWCGCTLLSMLAFREVYWPGSNTYQVESTTKYWSTTTWNLPQCVFVPQTAKSVGVGIWAARLCSTDFAIRGGGHMPVPGFTGTKTGILFGLSALNTLSLSSDKTSVFVGPGRNWGEVYSFLAPHGQYALGGRIQQVGVPGLLLGGGLNFFSNRYGFAMDNILSYECVLANGHVVIVTADNKYRDLFWALHGGSSNFCIVTKFELKTYFIPKMWGGLGTFVGQPNFDLFYSFITNFTNSAYVDKGAGLVSLINFAPGQPDLGIHCAGHEGDDPDPAIFNEFKKLAFNDDSIFGMMTDTAELPKILGRVIVGQRHVFRVQSSIASVDALKIVHETFYGLTYSKLVQNVPSVTSCAVAIQGVPVTLLEKGASNGVGGNTFGINQTQNYFWYNIYCTWADAVDDSAINAWVKEVGADLSAKFRQAGLTGNGGREFLYLNDAQGDQDCFAGYGPNELTMMKKVRDKYDPRGIFGVNGLSKGGFKF